jgi:hypothetical protein
MVTPPKAVRLLQPATGCDPPWQPNPRGVDDVTHNKCHCPMADLRINCPRTLHCLEPLAGLSVIPRTLSLLRPIQRSELGYDRSFRKCHYIHVSTNHEIGPMQRIGAFYGDCRGAGLPVDVDRETKPAGLRRIILPSALWVQHRKRVSAVAFASDHAGVNVMINDKDAGVRRLGGEPITVQNLHATTNHEGQNCCLSELGSSGGRQTRPYWHTSNCNRSLPGIPPSAEFELTADC